jgi:hypothetical protein
MEDDYLTGRLVVYTERKLLSLWCVWFCGKKVEQKKIVKIDG